MRNVIVSARIRNHPENNSTPILVCEGSCVGATAHEFSHLELRYDYHPEDPPGLNMIYRCDTCNRARRWGCLTWAAALGMDPSLFEKLSGSGQS